jgi:hypothetical protein
MNKYFLFLLITVLSAVPVFFASAATTGYAWSDNAGWINFGCTHCNVQVTDNKITGYIWSDNYGWIKLDASSPDGSGGVKNNGSGVLSGYAWGDNTGWIDFSGVTINISSGKFEGTATADSRSNTVGAISFDCSACNVHTDWQATVSASNVSINSGAPAVNLLGGTTKNVSCTATVSDDDGYSDITNVTAKFYRSGVGQGSSDNNSNHYTLSGLSSYCSGSGTSGTCTFNFSVYYYADPTDTGAYASENWVCQVTPSNSVGAGLAATSAIKMNTLKYITVSPTIDYGSLVPGQNTSTPATATVTNGGNVAAGFKVYGNNLTCSIRSSISADNQQYGLSSFAYGDGTALSGSATDTGANIDKPVQATPSPAQDTYWQIYVPGGTQGICSGSTSFIAD